MNLYIKVDGIEPTPSLLEYSKNKFDRVDRHFDQVVDMTVLLKKGPCKGKRRCFTAQARYHLKGKHIVVERTNEDLYQAIDELMGALDRQVVDHKCRVQDHHHTAAKRLEASAG